MIITASAVLNACMRVFRRVSECSSLDYSEISETNSVDKYNIQHSAYNFDDAFK